MLRQILTTILVILIPYVIYGIIGIIRRRRLAQPGAAPSGLWNGAPVVLLGLIGCVLAIAVLIAVAVFENDPGGPAYVPPINTERL